MVHSINQSVSTKPYGNNPLSPAIAFTICVLLVTLLIQTTHAHPSDKPGFANPSAQPLQLTDAERKWLTEHPSINLGFNPDMTPLLIKEPNGQIVGILPDIAREIEKTTGIKINIKVGPWHEIIQQAKDRKIDGLLACVPQLADANGLSKTSYCTWAMPVVFARKNTNIEVQNISDLKGKRVAYMKAVKLVESVIEPIKNDIESIEADSAVHAMTLVLEGKADVAVGMNYDTYHIAVNTLGDIQPIYTDLSSKFYPVIAIRPDWTEAVSIFDKALNTMGQSKLVEIHSKWVNLTTADNSDRSHFELQLTSAEKKWLETHSTIRVGLPENMPPFSFKDKNGRPRGLFVDFLDDASEKARIHYQISMHNWPDLIEAAKQRSIDLFPAINTPERRHYMNFTDAFFEIPYGIITRQNTRFVLSTQWLEGKKVSVVRNVAIHNYIEDSNLDIQLVPADNLEQALMAVSTSQTDAYIGDIITASYTIMNKKLANLKIAATADYPHDPICFASRNDWPLLNDILNKSVKLIAPEEHNKIIAKWLAVEFNSGVNWNTLWRWVAVAVAIVVILIALLVTWNRQLGQMVTARTAELSTSRETLRRSEQTSRTLLNAPTESLILFDRDMKFVDINNTGAARFGKTREQIIGESLYNLLPQDLIQSRKYYFDKVINEGITVHFQDERNGIILDNEAYPMFDDDGQVRRVAVYSTDITQQKRNETEREQMIDELEARNEELERFVYTVSHDLKTPLVTIRGYLGMLARDMHEDNTNQAADDIERIDNAANRMRELLEDLLQLSRIGRMETELQSVSLYELAHEAAQLVIDEAERKQISICVEPDMPEIAANRVRILEVFQNLIDNAVKYMPDQPASRIEIGCNTNGNSVTCFVKDNGRGIEPQYHKKVFELFAQLDQSTEGTGVGLAITKRIVEHHGGKIWVCSEGNGKGTTFNFTLPKKSSQRSQHESADITSA